MSGDNASTIPMNDLHPTHSGQTQTHPSHITLPNAQKGRGHRRTQGSSSRHIGHDGEEDKLNAMGKMYKRVLDSSVVVRYTVYVAPLALIIAIPIIVGATAAPDAMLAGVPIRWFFAWVEIRTNGPSSNPVLHANKS